MSECRVTVNSLSGTGGRGVRIDDQWRGGAYSLRDLTVFLRNAGRHEGGPGVWGH
jgi:hypothetical protein